MVPARRESRPLSALSLSKRRRERPRSPRRLALRMSSSIAATREAWSRLQTCEVTSEGNTAPTVPPRPRRRRYRLAMTGPPRTELCPGRGRAAQAEELLALASAPAVERFIVSTEARCELDAVDAAVRVTHGARAESPTRRGCSRARRRSTAMAATAGARRRPIRRRSRPTSIGRSRCSGGAVRSLLGEPVDGSGELPARRAIREMRAQKDVLEPRQLPVEVGSRPLSGAVTGSVHRSHSTSDGGSHLKVSHSERVSVVYR